MYGLYNAESESSPVAGVQVADDQRSMVIQEYKDYIAAEAKKRQAEAGKANSSNLKQGTKLPASDQKVISRGKTTPKPLL